MNAIELSSSISRFVDQIKPTNDPSNDTLIRGLPNWFIEDLENSAIMLRQQEKEIEQLKLNLRLVMLDNSSLRKELENCTCQDGHSETYLKVKGRLPKPITVEDLNNELVFMKGKING